MPRPNGTTVEIAPTTWPNAPHPRTKTRPDRGCPPGLWPPNCAMVPFVPPTVVHHASCSNSHAEHQPGEPSFWPQDLGSGGVCPGKNAVSDAEAPSPMRHSRTCARARSPHSECGAKDSSRSLCQEAALSSALRKADWARSTPPPTSPNPTSWSRSRESWASSNSRVNAANLAPGCASGYTTGAGLPRNFRGLLEGQTKVSVSTPRASAPSTTRVQAQGNASKV